MSRLFDPLGLGPVFVKAKIFVQQLWKFKLSWDESLPTKCHTAWKRYGSELLNITRIRIPRNVRRTKEIQQQELHIFCDASLVRYGACAYKTQEPHSILTVLKLLRKRLNDQYGKKKSFSLNVGCQSQYLFV